MHTTPNEESPKACAALFPSSLLPAANQQEKGEKIMDETDYVAMKEQEQKEKAILMEEVSEQISEAVAAMVKRQDDLIGRLLLLEAEVNKLKVAVANKKDENSGGDYSELD